MKIRDRIKEFRRVRAAELLPNPKNWRVHPKQQSEALRGLLQEVGYADALLVRETAEGRLMLIDGHLRAETTPSVEVPVLVLDVNEVEADKILLTLDPLAGMAGKNDEQVSKLLESVEFESKAVGELLERIAGEEGWQAIKSREVVQDHVPIDQAAELQKEWNTETGQLWRIGHHRLLCGDSTSAQDVMRLMDGERASLFATDPPYAVGYKGGSHPPSRGNGGAANRDKDWSAHYSEAADGELGAEFYREFVRHAVEQAITSNAAWYCWHASRNQAMVEAVWNDFNAFVHQQIIWVKTRPVLTYSTYLWQHEPCLFGWIRGERPSTSRALLGNDGGYPTTVWDIPSAEVESDAHPTSKPVKLFIIPIEMHTQPGEICYEPFAGSGSQIVAAAQTNRRCYAIEKSPAFVAVALERLGALGLKPQLMSEST